MDLSYDEAMRLLRAHNTNESLVKHGIAVGAAVAAYAEKFGEDVERWRIAGLLHDVDYERHPTIEEHGKVGAEWLRALGYPEDIIHAVHAHNEYHGVPRDDLSRWFQYPRGPENRQGLRVRFNRADTESNPGR